MGSAPDERNRRMDLRELAEAIDRHLKQQCKKVDAMTGPDEKGGAWRFVVDRETIGFLSCENNEEDIRVPTVSTAVYLGDLTGADKKFLLRLLELNGSFFQAHFTVQNIDGARMLFIEQRVAAESYSPERFKESVDHLVRQYALFFEEPLNAAGR